MYTLQFVLLYIKLNSWHTVLLYAYRKQIKIQKLNIIQRNIKKIGQGQIIGQTYAHYNKYIRQISYLKVNSL